jgi:hypothetical protein
LEKLKQELGEFIKRNSYKRQQKLFEDLFADEATQISLLKAEETKEIKETKEQKQQKQQTRFSDF